MNIKNQKYGPERALDTKLADRSLADRRDSRIGYSQIYPCLLHAAYTGVTLRGRENTPFLTLIPI